MLKEERMEKIVSMFNTNDIIKISDIKDALAVTEMTVRRDLKVLEEKGLLTRIYGGAKRNKTVTLNELSSNEKRGIHIEEKKYIAEIAAKLVKDNDIIYIGPGTTNELIYDYLNVSYAKIITNSMPVFLKFKDDSRYEVILIGGQYRSRTDVFVGNFTNILLEKLRVKMAFVGTNGIYKNNVTTSSEEEGVCQKIILDNAAKRYILLDSSKIDKEDFFCFYDLRNVTAVITDNKMDSQIKREYEKIVKVINN
ncbi:DeoR/GlpR family DNA-binding transcription regulator [Clostridium akagii]|uniref:DeoR/GlpR family DNA-binding transcription regulator n=1 Tax=Clostridium akagii TaxID=91623 RepID=UPI00047C5368|nr:DeoR/GlpR family DNA-binding transcription regulator [Clostridium akagii]